MIKDYKLTSHPISIPENVIRGEKYRITLLTDRLVRLEYAEDGVFEDRATQVVQNRNFAKTEYTVKDTPEQLEVFTKYLHVIYNREVFSPNGLSISVHGADGQTAWNECWHYGEKMSNLGGTARTLDTINGACPLEPGLMSRKGAAVHDDSRSLVIDENGWVQPRKKGICDIYFFGYGHDYRGCLRDFYYLTGKTPMIPRYALGNWWSRYYEYTEESYMELMQRFDAENIPFTVAVIDMDWHLVNIDPKYGSGWTGYTWNREFFPDPERFMSWLHDRGMKITMNLHPADGIRAHEKMYPQMAEAMGIDPATEEPVNFDVTDPHFIDEYFEKVLHPHEESGVDFWWIDWQQGSNTKIEGLDPLWMLNHFHYLDSGRDGKRPMTFSRYAGPGSHRYPVGFSGDTHVTWESLDFQPYFTNTASNIGYGWWSHDIGGHMMGEKNDEMAGRWLQYGVFSPVNRLHSTKNEFNGKEPWRYKKEIHEMMNEFLRLRHRLIPYLYTLNYRAYSEDIPMIEPVYYHYPEEPAAYEMKNPYFFGEDLLVAPITTPRIAGINMAKVTAWLPDGIWHDIFTGMTYRGGHRMELYRDINSIPVLAKAGAILPLTDEISCKQAIENPTSFTLKMYAGDNGSFTLYEDDNETCAYEEGTCVRTAFTLDWNGEKQSITIAPAQGELTLIPEKRSWKIELCGCTEAVAEDVHIQCADKEMEAAVSYDFNRKCLVIDIPAAAVTEKITVVFDRRLEIAENRINEMLFAFLDQAEIGFDLKTQLYGLISKNKNRFAVINELRALKIADDLEGCLTELMTAY